jgi:hypothetical protein
MPRALDLYNALSEAGTAEEPPSEGFLVPIQPEHGGSHLWLRDNVSGDPERLIQFVKLCAAEFGLKGHWAFGTPTQGGGPRISKLPSPRLQLSLRRFRPAAHSQAVTSARAHNQALDGKELSFLAYVNSV